MSETSPPVEKPSVVKRFVGDVFHMPTWQKLLLGLALVAGVAGAAGQVYSKATAPPPPPETVGSTGGTGTTPPGKSFVGGSPQSPQSPTTAQPAATPESTWLSEHSPGLTRTGVSFVGAFIIGWAFRVFVKTMALVAMVGAAIMLALSYFRVINIDFSAAEHHYAAASTWLWDQASHLKDAAMAHLPASTSGAAGLFVGFRKK